MITTRSTLIDRIKDLEDKGAWREFHKLYAPLIYRYARARGLSRVDAEEIRDECIEVVVNKISNFRYERTKGGFKNWLRCIAGRKIIDRLRKRKPARLDTDKMRWIADDARTPDQVWEDNWLQHHLRSCLASVKRTVSADKFRVFQLLMDGHTVLDVCSRLDLNSNQVYKRKSAVLQQVRQCMNELDCEFAS